MDVCVGEGGKRAGGELGVKTLEGPRGAEQASVDAGRWPPGLMDTPYPQGTSGSEGGNGLRGTDYLLRPQDKNHWRSTGAAS